MVVRRSHPLLPLQNQTVQTLPAMKADAGHDPLPSWRQGALKTNLLDFVESVSDPGSPDFVAPQERIAVFDNDGTLWSEQPMYAQMAVALHRARRLVAERSDLARDPLVAAAAAEVGGSQPCRDDHHGVRGPGSRLVARRPPSATGCTSRCWSCWLTCAPGVSATGS